MNNVRFVVAAGCFLVVSASTGLGQTTEEWIAQGRERLRNQDLTQARTDFAAAVASSPDHETANFFLGTTRLLTLTDHAAVQDVLDRIGIAETNRSVYPWSVELRVAEDGSVMRPSPINAEEVVEVLHGPVLDELSAAIANFAKVQTPEFLVLLEIDKTGLRAVEVDYGDVTLLRALSHLGQYLIHNVRSWNLDARLEEWFDLMQAGRLTVQRVLEDHPALLTFDSPEVLASARVALEQFIDAYLKASLLIRSRPVEVARLFNTDPEVARDERQFREVLEDIRASFDTFIRLRGLPQYEISAAALFPGDSPPRDWLPEFYRDHLLIGTWPDASFGGVVEGLTHAQWDRAATKWTGLDAVVFARPVSPTGNLELWFSGLPGWQYVLEGTGDLENWDEVVSPFNFAYGSRYWGVEVPVVNQRQFFRLAPSSRPHNDDFRTASRLPSEARWRIDGSLRNATWESGEPVPPHAGDELPEDGGSVWFKWTAPQDGVLAAGNVRGRASLQVFTGGTLEGLEELPADGWTAWSVETGLEYHLRFHRRPNPWGWNDGGEFGWEFALYPQPLNASPATAERSSGPDKGCVIGHTYGATKAAGQPAVNGEDYPLVWYRWLAVDPGRYRVAARSRHWVDTSPITFPKQLAVFDSSSPTEAGRRTDWGTSVVLDAEAEIEYLIAVTTGPWPGAFCLFIERAEPVVNDRVGSALALSGITGSLLGSTAGATADPEAHDLWGGSWDRPGETLWWTWTAPGDGDIEITDHGSDFDALGGLFALGPADELSLKGLFYSWDWEPGAIFPVQAGTQYYIGAGGWDGDGEWGQVRFGLAHFPPPPNDPVNTTTALRGDDLVVSGTNRGASSETDEPNHAGLSGGRSVWWSWQPPGNGHCRLSTAGSTFQTLLAVYRNGALGFHEVATSRSANHTALSFEVQGDVDYLIAVDGAYGEAGDIVLHLVFEPPPLHPAEPSP